MKKQFLCISTLITVCNIHSADKGAPECKTPHAQRRVPLGFLIKSPHRNLKPNSRKDQISFDKNALPQIRENPEESNKNNE